MVWYRTLVRNRPLTRPQEPLSAAIVADYLTGSEPLYMVNIWLGHALMAGDMALGPLDSVSG
jgi:hypothetical protein